MPAIILDSSSIAPWLTRYELRVWGDPSLAPEVAAQVKPRLKPLHTEVQPERDGVVLVADPEHVANLKSWKVFRLIRYPSLNYLVSTR